MSVRVEQVAQRASRQFTGYHSGYTFKAQKTPKKALDAAFTSLNYFQHTLTDKTEAQQHRRTVTHVAADVYHNTTKRPNTEEFNLSMNLHEQDAKNAEYIRTYYDAPFCGKNFKARYELERKSRASPKEVVKVIPQRDGRLVVDLVDVYGFRPKHELVWYLNPWEFTMYWTAEQRVPEKRYEGDRYLAFPKFAQCETPSQFVLIHRRRPAVPAPSSTPMSHLLNRWMQSSKGPNNCLSEREQHWICKQEYAQINANEPSPFIVRIPSFCISSDASFGDWVGSGSEDVSPMSASYLPDLDETRFQDLL